MRTTTSKFTLSTALTLGAALGVSSVPAAAATVPSVSAAAAITAATDGTTGVAILPAASGSAAHDHQVARLFRATLGRNPDADGLLYWSGELQNGASPATIVQGFLDSDEHARRSSGDPIVDAYRWALQREPDEAGYTFWSSMPVTEAVLAIADSAEHQRTTGTLPPPVDGEVEVLSAPAPADDADERPVDDTRTETDSDNDDAGTSGAIVLPASTESEAHDHQVARLYRATLGRDPDASGLVFWSEQLQAGVTPESIVEGFLESAEHADRSSGDAITDAYRWALLREPDAEGHAYWSSFPETEAVLAIADSEEHQATTNTVEPPEPVRPDVPAHWVDAGHGVWVPPILIQIRFCESRHDYSAANTRSSARGAYQFLTGSWEAYGHAERYGVPFAHLATPAQQDEAALITWQVSGTRPWNASRHCWG